MQKRLAVSIAFGWAGETYGLQLVTLLTAAVILPSMFLKSEGRINQVLFFLQGKTEFESAFVGGLSEY